MRTLSIILLAMTGAVVATAGPVISQQDQGQLIAPPAPASPAPAPIPDAIPDAIPSGGMLRTMPHGNYECALPGDASGRAYEVVKAEGFRISTASRYRSETGEGSYILRGDELTFTAGPKNGERFERIGENQLRKTDANGNRGDLICTRLADRRR